MKDAQLYYTAPSDEAFEDMKKACMSIWNTMGNDGGYRDEKIARIEHIGNIEDNFMYMFAMFDIHNQRKVVNMLQESTKKELTERLVDGGNNIGFLVTIGL